MKSIPLLAALPVLLSCAENNAAGDKLVPSLDLSKAGGQFVAADVGVAGEFSSIRVLRGDLRDVIIIQKIVGAGWPMAGQRAAAIAFAFRVDCAKKSYKLAWQDFFDGDGNMLGHLEASEAQTVSDPRNWTKFAQYCGQATPNSYDFYGVAQFLSLADARVSPSEATKARP